MLKFVLVFLYNLPMKKGYNITCFACVVLLLSACGSKNLNDITDNTVRAGKITFKTYVDTRSKKISFQDKKIYSLKNLEVYATNKFDGARLNGFEKLNDSTALVFINPENTPINKSPYYAFKIWSKESKPFYLKFEYPIGYKHRYTPKMKFNNEWSIIDEDNILKEGKTVTIKVNLQQDTLMVAAQEVHNSKDVEDWYTLLTKGKEAYINIHSVGKSILGKNLPVLDIYKGDKKNKKVIVLLTRQHPPEVTGYFAFQAFLKTILNDSELSTNFLDNYRVLAFPILNPDGVDLGHWRHSVGGVDLNRDWSQYHQPEIRNVVNYIEKVKVEDNAKIILGLDFHSTFNDVFYTNKDNESTSLPNFIEDWFEGLEENIPNYQVNEKSSNIGTPVSKGWFLLAHNAVGVTFEIGDDTSKEFIDLKGKVAANQMMKILINNNK